LTESRKGPFWDVLEGRKPQPAAAALLGFELLAVDAEAGTIKVKFQGKPEFANPMGNIQGGILAAMLDDTLGPALVATLGPNQFAPTIELKVNFIHPAQLGPLIATGRVVARRRAIAFLSGELHDERGELLATASATARIVTLNTTDAPER
jgi:uncharacterized protein (TIGR00369 family)